LSCRGNSGRKNTSSIVGVEFCLPRGEGFESFDASAALKYARLVEMH
jgi:hypothetical protein